MTPTHILKKTWDLGGEDKFLPGTMAEVGSGRLMFLAHRSGFLPVYDVDLFRPFEDYFERIPKKFAERLRKLRDHAE